MENNNLQIIVKSLAIKHWKPKMDISDFHIVDDSSNYSLNKIISQDISQKTNSNNKVSIEYYDSKTNFVKVKKIVFKFNKDKKTTLQEILQKKYFVFDTKKLNSLDFINFNKNDVKILKSNLKLENLEIKNWSIFNQKITFKLDCLFYDEIKRTLEVEEKMEIDHISLIKSLLVYNEKKSFLKLNSYLEFEIKNFSPTIKGYKNFFSPDEYKKLFNIVNGIEIINPKILTNDIDIFSSEVVEYFNSSVVIDKKYINNFIFKSKYNAEYLKEFISTKLLEFPIRKTILGNPRSKNITFNDIYKDFENAHFHSVLKNIGIVELIEKNTIVKISNFNLKGNSILISIYLKSSRDEPLIKRRMKFEKNLISFLENFSKDNLISLKNIILLDKYPVNNLNHEDFVINNNDDIKILEVSNIKNTSIGSKWANYKFKLSTIEDNNELIFNYKQDFYFKNSKTEYLLEELKIDDLNIDYFKSKSDEYYHNLTLNNKLNQKLISITKRDELKNIIINDRFNETDFKVIKLKFNRNFIFKKQLPIIIFVRSSILKSTKTFELFFEIKNKKLHEEFKLLSEDDVKITNKKLLDSYPIPILDISDFYIKNPFLLFGMSSKYNDDNMSILCTFNIKFDEKTRIIKKEIYFNSKFKKALSPQNYEENLELFKKLTKKDILLNYDKLRSDYFIRPQVDFILPNKEFYASVYDWKLKSRFRKAVVLNIEIRYCDIKKHIIKKINYVKKIGKKNFKSWKESNYGRKWQKFFNE